MIKSIHDNHDDILRAIIKLHNNNNPIHCDPTYSKGVFYRNIEKPVFCYDINPIKGVKKASADNLPHDDNSLYSIVFDPPFLATKGPSLKSQKGNIINKRFSVFPSEVELHRFYKACLIEFYRVLTNKGLLVFKCQDKVSSGKQYFSHCFVYNEAIRVGFYPLDLFILQAKNRIVANWQKNQKHARKFHSYYWVFRKTKKEVRYL